MSIKRLIISTTAAMTIALSGALFAETAAEQAAAAGMAHPTDPTGR